MAQKDSLFRHEEGWASGRSYSEAPSLQTSLGSGLQFWGESAPCLCHWIWTQTSYFEKYDMKHRYEKYLKLTTLIQDWNFKSVFRPLCLPRNIKTDLWPPQSSTPDICNFSHSCNVRHIAENYFIILSHIKQWVMKQFEVTLKSVLKTRVQSYMMQEISRDTQDSHWHHFKFCTEHNEFLVEISVILKRKRKLCRVLTNFRGKNYSGVHI